MLAANICDGSLTVQINNPPAPSAPAASPDRWKLLFGVWLVYAGFGLLVGSTAALVPTIRPALDLSRTQMGLILGAWQFVYLAASVPAGKAIDRFGLRAAIAFAAVVMAASGFLRAGSQGFLSLLLGVALFGIGGPLISIGAPKLVAEYFSDAERRKAVGIYGTGPAVGSAGGLALTNSVVMPLFGDDWRSTMALFAVVSLACGLAWLVLSRGVSAHFSTTESHPSLNSRQLLQVPIVRLILVLATGAFFYSHALSNWLVDILEDAGWSAAAAGYWASFPTLLGIVATLYLPRFATPERRVAILSGGMLLGAAGLLFVAVREAVVLAPALVSMGLARTAVMPVCMLILMDHKRVGPKNMAAVGGLFFTSAEIGGVLGPFVTGLLADATDGFTVPVWVLSGVLFVMALLSASRLGPVANDEPTVSYDSTG